MEFKGWRVVEMPYAGWTLGKLEGDRYDPKVNIDISPKVLEREKLDFKTRVYNEGIWGYALERWNSEIGKGWEHVASCWGFIGRHTEGQNEHYIVYEYARQAIEEGASI
jgi:hypothetical protein